MLEFLSLKQCKDYIANFTSSQSGSVQKERDFNFFLEFKDMNHNQIYFLLTSRRITIQWSFTPLQLTN